LNGELADLADTAAGEAKRLLAMRNRPFRKRRLTRPAARLRADPMRLRDGGGVG
jgi:hypothetical protein